MRETLEQAIFRDLASSYDKSQEFRIRLILQKQHELLESGLNEDALGRAFIRSDNEFHNTLYEMAGKKNVMDFLKNINSQYERFRTFSNFTDRSKLLSLYDEHTALWQYISGKDYEKLSDTISHHIYDGFNANTEIVCRHPEYFKAPEAHNHI